MSLTARYVVDMLDSSASGLSNGIRKALTVRGGLCDQLDFYNWFQIDLAPAPGMVIQ